MASFKKLKGLQVRPVYSKKELNKADYLGVAFKIDGKEVVLNIDESKQLAKYLIQILI